MVFDDDRQITLARDVKPVKPGTFGWCGQD